MARNWEDTFRRFSKTTSDAEDEKCERVVRMVRMAVAESPALQSHTVRVFPQGSYRNLTNARLASDVDVCIFCTDTFFHNFDWADGFRKEDVGIAPATYAYSQYKNDVQAALEAKFGKTGVTRSNKAFDVHENSCRVDADVVACFEQRYYTRRNYDGTFSYVTGTHFVADDGNHVENWPDQNYANGVEKNNVTSRRFKLITRALKQIRYEMKDLKMTVAQPIPSYLVECLLYNTPNDQFGHARYEDDVRAALDFLIFATANSETCNKWLEENEIKYLFHATQPWTLIQVQAFLQSVWTYVEFDKVPIAEKRISSFLW